MAIRRALPVIGLTLSLLGAGIAGYLTIEHGRGASPICAFGQGCEVVAQSTYASLGGVPTAAFGLLMYLTLAVLYAVRLFSPPPARVEPVFRLATLGIALVGSGISAWLTYVQAYILNAMCIWCVSSEVTISLLLIVATVDVLYREASSPLLALRRRSKFGEGEGRSGA